MIQADFTLGASSWLHCLLSKFNLIIQRIEFNIAHSQCLHPHTIIIITYCGMNYSSAAMCKSVDFAKWEYEQNLSRCLIGIAANVIANILYIETNGCLPLKFLQKY